MSASAKEQLLALTRDDAKILGKLLDKRREKSILPNKFHTSMFKTHNSNWTPMVHKPANQQVKWA